MNQGKKNKMCCCRPYKFHEESEKFILLGTDENNDRALFRAGSGLGYNMVNVVADPLVENDIVNWF